jgi:hypothetical protein
MNKYIAILLLSLASFIVKGQDETVIFVNYLPGMTLGETANFTNNFSPRGVDFEVNKYLREDLSVGFVIAWNIFREKIVNETFDFREVLITGTQFRYLNTTPINLNVKKYFTGGERTPYVGLGLGTSYTRKRVDIGVYTVSDEKWQFNVAPEVGMLIDVSRRNILSLKVKYNYSPKAGDFQSISYLSFGVGLGFN